MISLYASCSSLAHKIVSPEMVMTILCEQTGGRHSDTTLASATNGVKAKVRYQQKALNAGNKIKVGIELKILGSKVMTVISLKWNLYLALTAGNRRQQVTSVVRRISLVHQALYLHL